MSNPRRIFLSALAAALAAASAHAAAVDEKAIIGDWFSETDALISLEHFKADGSFSIDFRQCFKSGARDHNESGHWTVENGHLYMTTELVWGKPTHLTDELETVSSDGTTWTRRVTGGDALRVFGPAEFKAVKVTADSKLPGCDLSS